MKTVTLDKIVDRAIGGSIVHNTREGWLMAAASILDTKYFHGNGHDLGDYRVSCGICGGKSIGVCYDKKCSEDKMTEIFIDPTQAEPVRVLDILLHELIHAACPPETKHGSQFKKMAKEFGLSGKMTATTAPEGTDLHTELSVIAETLGHYPHAPMQKTKKAKKHDPWVRYVSINESKYKVVVNEDRVEEFGAPVDPWGDKMEPVKK